MAVLAQASIMDGTDNNHGMSDQIISIIQMQPAWVTVIMEQITLDTPLTLQDIIKVIMDAQISTMTTKTATDTEVGVEEVEADMVVAAAMGMVPMVPMKLSHNSTRSMAQVSSRIVTFQLVQRRMWPPRRQEMSMNSVERYVRGLQPKKILHQNPLKMRMRSRNQELLLLKTAMKLKPPQLPFPRKLLQLQKRSMRQCQSKPLTILLMPRIKVITTLHTTLDMVSPEEDIPKVTMDEVAALLLCNLPL
jgi:hypothetical protein